MDTNTTSPTEVPKPSSNAVVRRLGVVAFFLGVVAPFVFWFLSVFAIWNVSYGADYVVFAGLGFVSAVVACAMAWRMFSSRLGSSDWVLAWALICSLSALMSGYWCFLVSR